MEQNRSINYHHLLRAAIFIALAWYIVHLVKTDHLVYYIAPRMDIYIKLSAVVFQVLGLFLAFMAIRPLWEASESCGCDHTPSRSAFMNTMIYALFVLPLLLGFLLPDAVMGSNMAEKKGVNLSNTAIVKKTANGASASLASTPATPTASPSASSDEAAVQQQTAIPAPQAKSVPEDVELKKLFPSDMYDENFAKLGMKLYKKDLIQVPEEGFMEIVQSVDLFMDNFIGKKIELSGFVYRENDMKPEQFVIARFGVSCCSADASPFGVMVESSLSKNMPKDTWVKITGVIGKTTYNQNQIMKIDAQKIEKITAPKSPYVYPNYDFYDNYQ